MVNKESKETKADLAIWKYHYKCEVCGRDFGTDRSINTQNQRYWKIKCFQCLKVKDTNNKWIKASKRTKEESDALALESYKYTDKSLHGSIYRGWQ